MKKIFKVAPNRILVEPIRSNVFLQDDDQALDDTNHWEEMGVVIEVGSLVPKSFIKKGDTLFFVKEAYEQTAEYKGKKYGTVLYGTEFILGKIDGNKTK